ncbi:sugar phosphate isomerase/epimerase family protein [Mucilaginibacter ginsenosidivorans]|nr:TIM barrel protein [Mucilaginibacter ginsenosidivorans]
MNRRKFISQSTMGAGAMLLLPEFLKADGRAKVKHPIGFQTYPIRDMVTRDFAGTMKTMAGMGYQYTEMCYPAGYDDFKPLASVKASDLKKMIEDAGLKCPSCHFGMNNLKNNFGDCIEFAHALGMTQVVTPGLETPGKTIDDFKKACGELNAIAAKAKSEGLATGLHNHEGEFKMLDGELIYDAILGALDAGLVKMQFQTEVIKLGYKGSDYFKKYPGRFISAHLSDWTADKKQVPVGQGVIDWKEFFAAAKTGGVKNFFVEMNFDTYKDSASYIHGLLG